MGVFVDSDRDIWLVAIVAAETAGQAFGFSIAVKRDIWPILILVFLLLLAADLLLKPE